MLNNIEVYILKTDEGLSSAEISKIGHSALYKILDGKNIKDRTFIKNSSGKPYLKNNSIFFNISHTKNLIAIAVSDRETGIDTENCERKISDLLKARFNIKTDEDFLRFFTRAEAYLKFTGSGIKSINQLKNLSFPEKDGFFYHAVINIGKECYFFSCFCAEKSKLVFKLLDSLLH